MSRALQIDNELRTCTAELRALDVGRGTRLGAKATPVNGETVTAILTLVGAALTTSTIPEDALPVPKAVKLGLGFVIKDAGQLEFDGVMLAKGSASKAARIAEQLGRYLQFVPIISVDDPAKALLDECACEIGKKAAAYAALQQKDMKKISSLTALFADSGTILVQLTSKGDENINKYKDFLKPIGLALQGLKE